jgi:hypothetical protein
MCLALQTSAVVNELLDFAQWFNEEHRNDSCFNNTFANQVEQLSDISWDGPAAANGRKYRFKKYS